MTLAPPGAPLVFIGLTGGIGAGKSEALAAFARLGAATLSTDAVVHELLDTPEVRALLVERLGASVAPDEHTDRRAVAEVVFERPGEREWLEGLLWPRVRARVADWRAQVEAARPRAGVAVVEVPLLFEAGADYGFDATVAVVADDAVRAARAEARGQAGLEARSARQLTQDEKARRATFVARNDGDLERLERELESVLAKMAA